MVHKELYYKYLGSKSRGTKTYNKGEGTEGGTVFREQEYGVSIYR